MARRKQNGADGIVELVALLPWWVGVGLAIASYFIFRALSAPPKINPARVADSIIPMMVSSFAFYGKYIVPVICLVGAAVSFIGRRKRQSLVHRVVQARGADVLNGMSWREFEMLVGEAFRIQGYSVAELGGSGPDGGVDLVLRKGNEKFLVQCKHWKAQVVRVDVVRELYGVMAAEGATGGFVITSGRFSTDALEFASGRNVKLVDGSKLFGLIQQGRRAVDSRRTAPNRPPAPAAPPAASVPSCPVCNSEMVRRTAKKGANAGNAFWGCSRYPSCKGTRA